MDIKSLKPEQIQQVYSGRQGCMCGCKGKYSVNPAFKAEADRERGYEQPAAKHLGQIRKVLNILQNDPRTVLEDGYILHINDQEAREDERNYVAYLSKSAREVKPCPCGCGE